jgi:hypothetical protein
MPLVLTTKGQKLMKLCEVEGYKNAHDLLEAVWCDSLCGNPCRRALKSTTEWAAVARRPYRLIAHTDCSRFSIASARSDICCGAAIR